MDVVMLNRLTGELIGDLGRGYVLVQPRKWLDTNLWDAAVDSARAAFAKAGALHPIHIGMDDCIVQEYPLTRTVAHLFERKIAGRWYYHPYVVSLPPESIAELRVTGRWTHSASGTVH